MENNMPLPRPLNPTRGSITFSDSVDLLNGFRLDFSITSQEEGSDWTGGSIRLIISDPDLVDDDDESVLFNLSSLRIPYNEAPDVSSVFAKLEALGDTIVNQVVPTPST